MTNQLPPRALNRKQKRDKRRDDKFKRTLEDGLVHPFHTRYPNPNTANNVAWRINTGRKLGPGYEAHVRDGVIYVRQEQQ